MPLQATTEREWTRRTSGLEMSATLTIEDLAATLKGRTKHSEWVLSNFEPVGVFAAKPYEIWQRYAVVTKSAGIPEEFDDYEALAGEGAERAVDLAELRLRFPGIEIYSFTGRDIARWEGSELVPVSHEDLYPSAGIKDS